MVRVESANESGYHALPPLEPGTQYFWQAVPLAGGESLCAPGSCLNGCCPIWSFTTAASVSSADPADNPSPPDGASGVDLLPRLSWSAGDALAYSVYLWPAAEERPSIPMAAAIRTSELPVEEPLLPGTRYLWTVLALGSAPEQDSPGPIWSFTTAGGTSMRRGDANADGRTDLSDAITTLNYLFLGTAALSCLDAGDADDSGGLNITDAIYLLGHLFLGGPAPPAPGIEDCGTDPTDDALSCEAQPQCP